MLEARLSPHSATNCKTLINARKLTVRVRRKSHQAGKGEVHAPYTLCLLQVTEHGHCSRLAAATQCSMLAHMPKPLQSSPQQCQSGHTMCMRQQHLLLLNQDQLPFYYY